MSYPNTVSIPRGFSPQIQLSAIDSLLITGGTGFIGGAVLARLLDTPLWKKTQILVRAENIAQAWGRVACSIERYEPTADIRALLKDRQLILGSLEDTDLLTRDPRIAAVSHVIHCAANTSFGRHPRIRATNVDASLAFVRCLAENAAIKRFVSVGTAWCGGLQEAGTIREEAFPPPARHLIPYTETKLEFERAVRAELPTFPFISARPSIVVGHTKLGTKPSGSIYWVFRSGAILGKFMCEYDDPIDVVPVDWTAAALIQLLCKPGLKHDTYHLSAGPAAASTFGQLDVAIACGRNLPPHGRLGFTSVDEIKLKEAIIAARSGFGDVNPSLLHRALVLYGQFARSAVIFDNNRLLSEGIALPQPFASYAGICAETAESSSIREQMEADFKS